MIGSMRPARNSSVPEEESCKSSQKRTANYLSQSRPDKPSMLGGGESGASRFDRSVVDGGDSLAGIDVKPRLGSRGRVSGNNSVSGGAGGYVPSVKESRDSS